jgi:hypothetical protein
MVVRSINVQQPMPKWFPTFWTNRTFVGVWLAFVGVWLGGKKKVRQRQLGEEDRVQHLQVSKRGETRGAIWVSVHPTIPLAFRFGVRLLCVRTRRVGCGRGRTFVPWC